MAVAYLQIRDTRRSTILVSIELASSRPGQCMIGRTQRSTCEDAAIENLCSHTHACRAVDDTRISRMRPGAPATLVLHATSHPSHAHAYIAYTHTNVGLFTKSQIKPIMSMYRAAGLIDATILHFILLNPTVDSALVWWHYFCPGYMYTCFASVMTSVQAQASICHSISIPISLAACFYISSEEKLGLMGFNCQRWQDLCPPPLAG